jgi:hypothetical protein
MIEFFGYLCGLQVVRSRVRPVDRTYGAARLFLVANSSGIAMAGKGRCNLRAMGTKSREVIYGGRVRAAKMNADRARKLAVEAAREADRAEAHAVPAYGRLWWTGSALANHRAMSGAGLFSQAKKPSHA